MNSNSHQHSTEEVAISKPISELNLNNELGKDGFIYSSNPLLLNGKDWLIIITLVLLSAVFIPFFWRKLEHFEPELNYRIDRNNSQDYWLIKSLAELSTKKSRLAIIGDSAIWGHYVGPDQSLTAMMNKKNGGDQYLNLGVSGLHSTALNGLVQLIGSNFQNNQIIVQFAPIWIMNPKKDLSDPKFNSNSIINHPKLLPQFINQPPQYKAKFEKRLTICLERITSVFSLTEHWTIQSTAGQPFTQWMILNPYSNPMSKVSLTIDGSAVRNLSEVDNRSWSTKPGLLRNNIQWVPLKDSYQWQQFMEAVHALKAKDNNVFIFLGPFNIGMLTDESLHRYRGIQEESTRLLKAEGIPFHWAKDLPTNLYGDESHPIVTGYEELADDLISAPDFKNWIKGGK